ncbi:site-specific DNA-methyltransferase [Erythrobacter sp. AP23]|uniref:DNA-methyltransferase n=1 Tax=Erythrobacter sp. AP23 TaxID=499656 RepID=UPI00076CB512|nr:site-specific DNA-methyltransferase [Erythrobacter sp. AP23]KWV96488.1 DNA methylase [Erythrobacter sp. AP23]
MKIPVIPEESVANISPTYTSSLGELYEADCLTVLKGLDDEAVDTVFADPPFNLKKLYGTRSSDDLSEERYLDWCREWIEECNRTLKKGGSFFIFNLPKWNFQLAMILTKLGLDFRHWIAVEQKNCLPIQGRLYPAHYSLLYFTKGRPKTFHKIRTPIETCRHCDGEIRDYGGHRKAMNPNGVNLKDIWTDIPPVRHRKFKPAGRTENALSTKLLERVVEMSTLPGDLVLDPFGGSGTTYAVCEKLERRWIGCEIEDISPILARLTEEVEHHKNDDFVEYPHQSIAAE